MNCARLWIARRMLSSSSVSTAVSGANGATAVKAVKAKRYSGAQLEVLALYRAWMRAIRSKSVDQEHRTAMVQHVRSEFKQHAAVRLLDVERIERLLARGRKQLHVFRVSARGFEVTGVKENEGK